MKIWFFFLLFSFNGIAGITIVSDLDDTIKIMNSGNTFSAGINALKKAKTFSGIKEFFTGASKYSDELYILSASPNFLHQKILNQLNSIDIHPKGIILKKWMKFESKFDYKTKEILQLIKDSENDFILIGDDVGQDPEVYSAIREMFPDKVIAIYIHLIEGREIPKNIQTYYASFELAIKEYLLGRMLLSDVKAVIGAEKLLSDPRFVFPDFAVCPSEQNTWSWLKSTIFYTETLDLADSYLNFCHSI